MKKRIERTQYLDKLKSLVGTPDIKVITGIRRCGKSELLKQFKKYVEAQKGFNVISVDLSLPENRELRNYDSLYKFISERYRAKSKNVLLVDEVQMCEQFEDLFNGLYSEGKYDIYITGSNAFLTSNDLATYFTGRVYLIPVFPFSFEEFLKYYGLKDIDEGFRRYVAEGGMAGAYEYNTAEEKNNYLANVYETMIIRDVETRFNVRNVTMLRSLSNFLMDNISNVTSANKIANTIGGVNNKKPSSNTISDYLAHLCNAYAFYEVPRYDIKGKKRLASMDKYYLVDHAFRQAIIGAKELDYGRVYENIVAIELLRRGYEIYTGGGYKNREVDFVAIKRNEKIYIQVADDISNGGTLQRELASLLDISDAYPKIILANTRHGTFFRDGVRIMDLAGWLGDKSELAFLRIGERGSGEIAA